MGQPLPRTLRNPGTAAVSDVSVGAGALLDPRLGLLLAAAFAVPVMLGAAHGAGAW
jgi:hypothetical protein